MLHNLKWGCLISVLFNAFSAQACDNCNLFLSINPNDYQNSFGLTYRSRYHFGTFDQHGLLNTKHGGSEVTFQNQQIEEQYRRLEITGNYFWRPRWRAQIVLPYISNVQSYDGLAKYVVNGIGDPILIQNFQVFSTQNGEDSLSFSQRWEIGAGVKLPVGSISRSYDFGTPNIDLQTGSGSLDALLTTSYIAKYKQVGWSTQLSYRLNSNNKNHFKYGNTLNLQSSLFYQKSFSKFTVMPTLGVYSEVFENEQIHNVESLNTEGTIWMMDFGINWFVKNIRITGNYQPVISSLLKDSQSIPVKSRFAIGVNYTF